MNLNSSGVFSVCPIAMSCLPALVRTSSPIKGSGLSQFLPRSKPHMEDGLEQLIPVLKFRSLTPIFFCHEIFVSCVIEIPNQMTTFHSVPFYIETMGKTNPCLVHLTWVAPNTAFYFICQWKCLTSGISLSTFVVSLSLSLSTSKHLRHKIDLLSSWRPFLSGKIPKKLWLLCFHALILAVRKERSRRVFKNLFRDSFLVWSLFCFCLPAGLKKIVPFLVYLLNLFIVI